jgi:anti-sigma regulatory factor (Ser/Thr protein kinase)
MFAQASSSALMARFGLAASPSAPYQARRQVRRAMASLGIDPEVIETAALIASELVANAARAAHEGRAEGELSAPSMGQILVTLWYGRQALRIEVTDGSPSPPVLKRAPPDAESGRGMFIVDALAAEWSYSFLPAGLGKTVYCVLPMQDRPDADDLRAAS